MNILVTGGLGFIGSHYIQTLLRTAEDTRVITLDAMTYASNFENIFDAMVDPRHEFIAGNITDRSLVLEVMKMYKIDHVVNFAAESHVDRSISDSSPFVQTNIVGVSTLLDAFREYCSKLKNGYQGKRFIQISTDEVYGDGNDYLTPATEHAALVPSSPYAAAKASADLMVQAYHRTYQLPTLITRSSNNYGSHQHHEKFIPTVIAHALSDEPVPIYGDGLQERDWLHVKDNCRAIDLVRQKGKVGEIYNIATNNRRNNRTMAKQILSILDKPENLLTTVSDRPGHDRSYRIDNRKIQTLGWEPTVSFDEGLRETVSWYINHPEYIQS